MNRPNYFQIDLPDDLRKKVEDYCKKQKMTHKEFGKTSFEKYLKFRELEKEGYKIIAEKDGEKVLILF